MTQKDWLLVGAAAVLGIAYWRRDDVEQIALAAMGKLTRSKFIELFGPSAVQATSGTSLFPSVLMAQAILESGDGNSSLTRDALNFFGIKADASWTGPYVVKSTKEYVNGQPVTVDAKFRKYGSATQSFQDRNAFLKKNSRYANAGVFSAATPDQQAQALQRAGYATDPDYASKLISLMSKNNLYSLD